MIHRAADSSLSFGMESDTAEESPVADGRMPKSVGPCQAGDENYMASLVAPE